MTAEVLFTAVQETAEMVIRTQKRRNIELVEFAISAALLQPGRVVLARTTPKSVFGVKRRPEWVDTPTLSTGYRLYGLGERFGGV